MKRILALILSLLLLIGLAACKKAEDSDAAQKNGESENAAFETVSMYDLSKAMEDAAQFEKMNYRSSADDAPQDAFSYISTMDYEKIDAFFITYASNKETPNADEICVIAVKNADDVGEAEASLRAHREKRVAQYENYAPNQVEKVENALIFSHAQYAVLIISDDNAPVRQAFLDFVR